MGKINLLGFELANLIAAGEVVERPSSVLKELIENSIDSGATQIIAEIKHGGISLIRVTDNGSGIEKEDLPVALKRHATSKIKEKNDLNSIMTLGFRGEALAAISSVSKMTIITKTKEAEEASMLTAESGNIIDINDVCAADGTTVVVSDLFYNVPARRKFLKKDSTEAMNVTALVERVALSRPDISIQLLIDGEEKFHTPGDDNLKNAIYSVYGRDFASKLIETEGVANGMRVHGFIGRSDNVKKNRNLMNVFINGRFVKSITAQTAIEKAYTSYIAKECFPTCVLFLEMNPSMVDVNVHPAKLEVKFVDERAVFETVYYTVKNSLEKAEYRPEMEIGAKKSDHNLMGAYVPLGADTKGEQISLGRTPTPPPYITRKNVEGAEQTPHTERTPYTPSPSHFERTSYTSPYTARQEREEQPISLHNSKNYNYGDNTNTDRSELSPKESISILETYKNAEIKEDSSLNSNILNTQTNQETQQTATNKTPENETFFVGTDREKEEHKVPEYRYVGEAFDTYVIFEYDGDLTIMDKHAAHERVIFEDLKRSREVDGRVASQFLMIPLTVTLNPEELECANEYKEDLLSVGFEYEIKGEDVEISAIPDAISSFDAESLFIQMTDELLEGKGNPKITEKIRREKALYQVACKGAIKGGRVYSREVIDWLIGKVLSIPDITVCPHGRPIAYRLTKTQLDRQFDRLK